MFKLKPYKRKGPRISEMRNKPCPCGATKTIDNPNYQKNFEKEKPDKPVILKNYEVDTTSETIVVSKKYKECCFRKDWPKSVFKDNIEYVEPKDMGDKTLPTEIELASGTPELDRLGL